MKVLKAFKFELRPTGEQLRQMSQFAGCCRHVFNRALGLQLKSREAGEKMAYYSALSAQIKTLRRDPNKLWLSKAPFHSLQKSIKNLDTGWKNHFESLKKLKAGLIKPHQVVEIPSFKKKGVHDSFQFPDKKQFKVDEGNERIFLPKLGWIRYRKSRTLQGVMRSATVSRRAQQWFVSILVEYDIGERVTKATSAVGIDMGIKRFATFNDGSFIAPINSLKRFQKRLAHAQRGAKRCKKFSKNWKKVQQKVSTIHARIANVRADYLHKATHEISKNHALICIENLQIRNMSKSAKGTVEKPGKKVKQKSGLNKAILDQGWGEFRRQLEYKTTWYGSTLIAVPAHHTSQTCPACSHVSRDNRLTQALFACVSCGYENNADVVGAINILGLGQRSLNCGGD